MQFTVKLANTYISKVQEKLILRKNWINIAPWIYLLAYLWTEDLAFGLDYLLLLSFIRI